MSSAREPGYELEDALYCLLRTSDIDITVDGWEMLHIIRETDDVLETAGLMTLLPRGCVPIAVSCKACESGFVWSALIGQADEAWRSFSESKRWKSVYL